MVAERGNVHAAMEDIRAKVMSMDAMYTQKMNEMEQNFLGLSVTLEAKLKETQKKIQEDQMVVIDQAAKKFAAMEIKTTNANSDTQALHEAAKEMFEKMEQEVASTDANIQTLHDYSRDAQARW